MTFRTRLLATSLLAALLPVVALGLIVRHEMTRRLTAQYEQRVDATVRVLEEDLAQQGEAVGHALARLRTALADDNRFRRAAVDRAREERPYLLDYAAGAMDLTGLSMLQVQDEHGRIISSGHFRNEYDRIEEGLPGLVAGQSTARGGLVLIEARAPDAPFPALVRADSFRLGNRLFSLVGGVRVTPGFLARLERDAEVTVALEYPGDTLTSERGSVVLMNGGALVREVSVPFVDARQAGAAQARFRIAHARTALFALRRSIDRWFLIIGAATAVLAVALAAWLSTRISRPLVALADKTARIDLDRLDVDFRTDRRDEVGALSRLLGAMTDRLRTSAVRIKDAERRASMGELARQVNHDIKNGLTPIRNVLRHLSQLAASDPERLPDVYRERQDTLDAGIAYLDNLATNYARLSPRSERQPCDVNEIIRRAVADLGGAGGPKLRTALARRAVVRGDPVALRRILENLLGNAVDSLASDQARVTVSTAVVAGADGRRLVRITVADEGVGMDEAQVARIFDDFYTTKPDGTGLGLSIVRRLVMDLDGAIRVESEPGKGSRFEVDLPEAT